MKRRLRLAVLFAVPVLAVPLGAVPAQAASPPNVLNHVGSATKVLIVTSKTWTSTTAIGTLWQKRGATWVAARSNVYARIGRTGFKTDRHEGDGTTPAGTRRLCAARDEDLYRLRTSVYRYAAVVGFNDSPVQWGKGPRTSCTRPSAR